MKQLFILMLAISLYGCSKTNDATPVQPITPGQASVSFGNFIGKLLVCDSVRTMTSTSSVLTVVGKGGGFDLMFFSNGTYTNFGSQTTVSNYLLQSGVTIYYWTPPATLQATQFLSIKSMSGNNIQLEQDNFVGTTFRRYYTAQ